MFLRINERTFELILCPSCNAPSLHSSFSFMGSAERLGAFVFGYVPVILIPNSLIALCSQSDSEYENYETKI